QGLTFNSLLRAVWALTLARYLGEAEEATFGVLMSGRNVNLPGIEGMVGMCINTLPFRTRFQPEEPVCDYVRRVNQESGTLTEYEQCGLVDINRWAGLDTGNPLFQTLLVYGSRPKFASTANFDFKYLPRSGRNLTEYAYTVSFTEENESLALGLLFQTKNCDIHYARLMCRFVDHCMTTIVRKSASQILRQVPLPATEKALIDLWSTGPIVDFPQKGWPAHQLFTQHLATQPDAIALESATARFTYAEVYQRACAIAATLHDKGAQAGNPVALLFTRCPEFIFSYLAVLLVGGVCVPMDATNALDRLTYMLDLLDDPWVVTHSAVSHLFTTLNVNDKRVIYADRIPTSPELSQPPSLPVHLNPGSLAYIVFTSGTTGRPKGVQVSHRSLVNFILAVNQKIQLPAHCRLLQVANLSFDVCPGEMFTTFHVGGTLVLQDGELADDLKRGSACSLVPSVLAALDPVCYLNLHHVISGGEALPPTVAAKWSGGRRLHNLYGPSEATISSHCKLILSDDTVTIGSPLANVQCHILDDQLRQVPIGVRGEICIGGAGVSEGYRKQPELTEKAFVANPMGPGRLYRTGDLGLWLANGEVQVLGRKDFQVKLRGFRIELGEIESTCQTFPGVTNAVALVKEDRLVGYMAPSTVNAAELGQFIASRLPHYMVPDVMVSMDALPLTSVGKVDRRALQALDLPQESDVDGSDDHLISETFAILRRALAEALNLEPARVVPSASFLRLGGDSISAIQFSSRCKKYGLKLTVADILRYPLLARLEQCAEPALDLTDPKLLLDPTGPVPLTAVMRQVIPDMRHVNHFNQSFLLTCRIPLTLAVLTKAVHALVVHHDMLRVRLSVCHDEWRQAVVSLPDENCEGDELCRFALVTQAEVTAGDYDGWVLGQQQSINAEHGPVLACSLLTVAAQPYVFLTVHHLCVDFVSWRILLEDLETLLQGRPLPPKTMSFREWATLVNEHAQTLSDDLWPDHGPVAALPVDFTPVTNQPATYRTVACTSRHLGQELTQALYEQAAPLVDASPQEFMVTALALALATTFQLESIEVQMESHGRQPWRTDLDVSRTLGWFTSIYPATFHLDQVKHYPSLPSALCSLAHVKQRLRSLPDRGFPYGLLRYLKEGNAFPPVGTLGPTQANRVAFNYAGRFEQLNASDAFWAMASLSDGWSHSLSLDESVKHALSASCSYGRDHGLALNLQYATVMYQASTVESLTNVWLENLRSLIQAALTSPVTCRTASDFGLAGLSEPAFAGLVQTTLPTLGMTLEAVDDLYPCLPIQEGLLLATLKDPAAYMVQSTYDLFGPLDTKRLQEAWATTAQQHPILRTRFLLGLADVPHPNLQLVSKHTDTSWTVADWSGQDLGQAEAEYTRQERERGFDLKRIPIRFGLFYVAPHRHCLITSVHHAVLDGWSGGLFTHALLLNYAGRTPPPTGQLKDLVTHVQGHDPHKAEQFWAAQFDGVESSSLLVDPYCAPDLTVKPSDAAYYGTLTRTLELGDKVVDFAQAQGVTQSTLLRAAVALVLHHYTGSANPVFGTVVSGRNVPVPQVEAIIGPCINTLPCRARIDRASTIAGLLQALHQDSTAANDFEHCQLTDIHRWSGVSQEQPLFNVLFIYQNYPALASASDLPIRLEPIGTQDPTDFPLSLVAVQSGDQLLLKASFQAHTLSEGLVERFLDHLATAIRSLVTMAPASPVSTISILSKAEHEQLTSTWARNPVELPTGSFAHAGLLACVQSDPEHAAVRDGDQVYTYGQLHRMARNLAHQLHQTGRCGADQVIGILADNSVELIVGQLATWFTGSAFVVMSPDYPAARQQFIVDDAACVAVVGSPEHLSDLTGEVAVPRLAIHLHTLLSYPPAEDLNPAHASPTNLAYIIYTSGTTGVPKGVMIEHSALAHYLRGFNGVGDVSSSSVVPTILAPTFDVSISEIWTTLNRGGTVVIAQPATFHNALATSTRAGMTPSILSLFDPVDYPGLQSVLVIGEACPRSLVSKWAPHVEFINLYGPAEVTIATHHSKLRVGDMVTIGRPLSNVVGVILDEYMRPVPVGVTGQLYLGGKGLARGYLNRPDLTAEKFITWSVTNERLYQTGDLARWLPDGQIQCLGRTDSQIKLRGFRIELGEVEAALESHPAVTQACVVVQESHLVGYVCPGFSGEGHAIMDYVRTRLPHYMVPSALTGLAEFPRTRVGKVDRQALPMYDFRAASNVTDLSILSPAERQLVQAVADCLRLDPCVVGLDTTFFQIGGNSLIAIQLASRCQSNGLKLTVSDFDRQSTLRQLARRAAQVVEVPAQLISIPVVAEGSGHPTPPMMQFFDYNLTNPQVSAIPAMFEVRHPYAADQWQEAVAQVVKRHPMLRAHFRREPLTNKVSYTIGAIPADHYCFEHHEVATTRDMVERVVEAFQRLDFWAGRLSEFHVFDLHGTQYFFHCTHHLVNDYLTSSLISEEVELLLLGQPLPPTTTPFQAWAAHLHRVAQGIDPRTIQLPPSIPPLPTAFPIDTTADHPADQRQIKLKLTRQETHGLLIDACERLQASQLELILAGLLVAYTEVFGLDVLGLDFMTHGRQPTGPASPDVTRTVGYFAHNIPMVISASTGLDSDTALQVIRRQLPGLLREGPQLALVRHLHEFQDPTLRERFNIRPQIGFSYLAQLAACAAAQEPGLFSERFEIHKELSAIQAVNRSAYTAFVTARHVADSLYLEIIRREDLLPHLTAELFLTTLREALLSFLVV
ncbi:hypothetical protein IWQ60_009052, partial [Tieghemiomyces parasiticus]